MKQSQTIRFPSTSNLFIASSDRSSGTASQFSISKQQNILAGFFTRLAVTEVVLDWSIPNIVSKGTDSKLIVIIKQDSPNPDINVTVSLDTGFYTVASAIEELVTQLNADSAPAVFSITGTAGRSILSCTNPFVITPTLLSSQLSLESLPESSVEYDYPLLSPDLTRFPYIDFLCSQITYQQELKDGSTGVVDRDSLYRWVFSWDSSETLDSLGYPISQGYTPFTSRRYLAFPKQVKWDSTQPIGQMIFETVTPDGNKLPVADNMEFYMTLLVSEQ